MIFLGIEVVRYTERSSDLILSSVTLADVASVVEFTVVILGKLGVNLLCTLVQLLGKRKHTDLHRRNSRVEMENGTHIALADLFLIVR